MTPEQLAALVADLRIKSAMIAMGEKIQWGSDTALMDQAADTIEHLQAEVARLSAPPDDAEVAGLVGRLTDHVSDPDCITPSPIMCSAADALTRLSHTLAAEKAKREAMEEALAGLIEHAHNCERELTEDLHHVDFCGESLPLTAARATLAKQEGR